MAKKKRGKFHGIHITPKAGTHYEVRHDPQQEPGAPGEAMATMGSDEDNTKLFKHDERDALHKHVDDLMDAHEGKGGTEPQVDEVPKTHPMQKLKARRPV